MGKPPEARPSAAVCQPRPRAGLWLAAVLAATTLAHAGALGGGFVWDDVPLIESEPRVVELQPLADYFTRPFWGGSAAHPTTGTFYRPLTVLSYALEYRLWGPDPLPFHATNLVLHLVCCALVFGLALRAGVPLAGASAAALLFGTFPRLTESVSWVSGRTDLIAALGALGAWYAHRSEPERLGRRLAGALLLGLGLLGKEVAAAGGLAVVALEWRRWRCGGDPGRALRNLAPYAAACGVYLALHLVASGAAPPAPAAAEAPAPLTLVQRLPLAFQALGAYLEMLLDPLRPRVVIGVFGVVEPRQVALGAGVAAGLLALAWRAVRRPAAPDALAALALAGGAIAPVLHLVPFPIDVVAADRYLYLPAAGLAVGLAVAARGLRGAQARAALAACAVAGVAFGSATALRTRVWHDERTLWETASRHAPPLASLAHASLGTALLALDRPEEALPALQEAMRRDRERMRLHPEAPNRETTLVNLAYCLLELGRPRDALPILEGLVERRPTPLGFYNLALARAYLLDWDGAERALGAALARLPDYPRAQAFLADVHAARAAWEALPPPAPDEPVEVSADRAAVFVRLGYRRAAAALWRHVIESADAPPGDVRRATVYLVLRGDPALARRAIERLRAIPTRRAEADQLQTALDTRLARAAAEGRPW